MTILSLNARNQLAQRVPLTKLLGRSQSWATWIFDERPVGVAVEGTSRCMLVINEARPFTDMNDHNTMRFPQLIVDIWADPTRDPSDKSVSVHDATRKIEAIIPHIDAVMHTVDRGSANGSILIWGTAEQVAARTGSFVAGSQRIDGPDYSDVKDTDGGKMARLTYGVHLV